LRASSCPAWFDSVPLNRRAVKATAGDDPTQVAQPEPERHGDQQRQPGDEPGLRGAPAEGPVDGMTDRGPGGAGEGGRRRVANGDTERACGANCDTERACGANCDTERACGANCDTERACGANKVVPH